MGIAVKSSCWSLESSTGALHPGRLGRFARLAGSLLLGCAGTAPLAPLPAATSQAQATGPALLQAASTGERLGARDPSEGAEAPATVATVPSGDIGRAGPVRLLAAGASGAWVALCQGEPMALSLVLGAGEGEPIDALLASDPGGRFVVSARAGAVHLIDTQARSSLELASADVRRARTDFAAHRTLSFDRRGEHLAYLRRSSQESSVVVRRLEDGSERVFPVGLGEVYRLRLGRSAAFVTLDVIREDTNHNGRLDWPAPEESAADNACAPPRPLRYRTYQGRGDVPSRSILSLADGTLRDLPELVTTFADALLVRAPDGRLLLDAKGVRTAFAPAACAGRVLLADEARKLALVACDLPKKPGKREVWLFGPNFAKQLGAELQETELDHEGGSDARLAPIYPGAESALVDLQKRELVALPAGSRVLASEGNTAVIWRGDDLLLFTVDTKTEQLLARGVAKNPDLLLTGSTLLLSPFIVVGGGLPARLSPTPEPLALAVTGQVLTGSPGSPAVAGVSQGPLRWLEAGVTAF